MKRRNKLYYMVTILFLIIWFMLVSIVHAQSPVITPTVKRNCIYWSITNFKLAGTLHKIRGDYDYFITPVNTANGSYCFNGGDIAYFNQQGDKYYIQTFYDYKGKRYIVNSMIFSMNIYYFPKVARAKK